MKHLNGYKSDIRTEELVNRYQNGESVYSISKTLGVSVAFVLYRLKSVGVYEDKKTRQRREEEMQGFKCFNELNELKERVNQHEVDSMINYAKFISDKCVGCKYATWRCEKSVMREK